MKRALTDWTILLSNRCCQINLRARCRSVCRVFVRCSVAPPCVANRQLACAATSSRPARFAADPAFYNNIVRRRRRRHRYVSRASDVVSWCRSPPWPCGDDVRRCRGPRRCTGPGWRVGTCTSTPDDTHHGGGHDRSAPQTHSAFCPSHLHAHSSSSDSPIVGQGRFRGDGGGLQTPG